MRLSVAAEPEIFNPTPPGHSVSGNLLATGKRRSAKESFFEACELL
ncbi:MAG: hypothetical protein ACE15E_21710 [Acidobacteriota bacterium]